MAQPITASLTLEAWIKRYDHAPFEYINGEHRPLMPTVYLHSKLIRRLFLWLYQHCVANGLGEVFSETAFVLTYDAHGVRGSRVPDVMVITTDRWQQYLAETPDVNNKPIILVPDIVVEVVSPNDSYSDLQDKITHYVDDGVQLVWVVDPQKRHVTIYEGRQYQVLRQDDAVLVGRPVLPEFSVRLGDLFADDVR